MVFLISIRLNIILVNKVLEDTIAITSGNDLNINPSFERELGLIFQTNQNGNWDIALLPDSNGYWSEIEILANSSTEMKIQPKFFESTNLDFRIL